MVMRQQCGDGRARRICLASATDRLNFSGTVISSCDRSASLGVGVHRSSSSSDLHLSDQMIGAFGRAQVYWTIVSIESSGHGPSDEGVADTFIKWNN